MLLKGFIMALVFAVVVYLLLMGFDAVQSALFFASKSIGDELRDTINATGIMNYAMWRIASDAASRIFVVIPIAFVAILIVYSLHTKKR